MKSIKRIGRCYFSMLILFLGCFFFIIGCAMPKAVVQEPKTPVFRYERFVHNEGFRGKFANEVHEVITVVPNKKTTDRTFEFTGMIMGKLMKKRHEINIVRLDKDLTWDINMNKKRYFEYPIKNTAFQLGVPQEDPKGEIVYIEECCKAKTDIKRTGVNKIVNGYDATQVILTWTSSCMEQNEPNSTKITMEIWIATGVKIGHELNAFDVEYAKKIGYDIDMLTAVGQEALQAFPGFNDLALMLKDLEGYPILTNITVEDENYLKRVKEERRREDENKQDGDTSIKAKALGFFTKTIEDRKRKKQEEEDLKWGNAVVKVSIEARNFQNTDITASVFDLPEGVEKVAQKEYLEGEQGAALVKMKPARFVETACLTSLKKEDLGVDIYPGATVARTRPYGRADHNTQWFYKDKNNYRIRYATSDSLDDVLAFYNKIFGASRCKVIMHEKDGLKYREASCAGKTVTFWMDEQPIELKSAWSGGGSTPGAAMTQTGPETEVKMLGFELSRGSGRRN